MTDQRVIVVTGPTATGKSALGVLMAKAIGGEIVSADSMQVYKHLDIGAAKPSVEDRQGIPHHMIDVATPFDYYSAARYVREAALCIDDILSRGKQSLLVGGTGHYINSLLSGGGFLARGSKELRADLEARYEQIGGDSMLRELGEFDRESAAKLHANDKKRIIRAFEAFHTTGKPISQHDSETKTQPPRYDALKFALTFSDRETLYARIDRRVDAMLSEGLENEVRALIDMGVPLDSTAMQAIGYKEVAEAILGRSTLFDAIDKVKMESRRYAKRQLTWLRRDDSVKWITWEEEPDLKQGVQMILSSIKRN